MRIICRWNKKFENTREEERRTREAAEAKMNFVLMQKKLQEKMKEKNNGDVKAIDSKEHKDDKF